MKSNTKKILEKLNNEKQPVEVKVQLTVPKELSRKIKLTFGNVTELEKVIEVVYDDFLKKKKNQKEKG